MRRGRFAVRGRPCFLADRAGHAEEDPVRPAPPRRRPGEKDSAEDGNGDDEVERPGFQHYLVPSVNSIESFPRMRESITTVPIFMSPAFREEGRGGFSGGSNLVDCQGSSGLF